MNVYFVRHGQSQHNEAGKFAGTIDSGLTSLGEIQANNTAELLKDFDISYILSSDLSRAFDTALIIKNIIDKEDNIVLEKTDLLKEVYFGDIQGKLYGDKNGMVHGIESGTGESAEDLFKRGMKFIEKVQSMDIENDLLVVGHCSFISVIFALAENLAASDLKEYRNNWEFNNGDVKVLSLNV